MNTKAPIWIQYIAYYTAPAPVLAVVPKAAANPASPAIKCAIRLPDKVRYVDGVKIVRQQFSHCVYECVVGIEWVLILYGGGRLWRRHKDVKLSVGVAELKAA